MPLRKYRSKRNLAESHEPAGGIPVSKKNLQFVIQKHAATRLHYDFRLELDGVLKSWAIPKGPSMDPSIKRLAIEVEDHPLEYGSFEGTIPPGNYGAGKVIIWDRGYYAPLNGGKTKKEQEKNLSEMYEKGEIKFLMYGDKLKGEFVLVRISNDESKNQWLLIKKKDDYSNKEEILKSDRSVVTGETIEGKPRNASKVTKPHQTKPKIDDIETNRDKIFWPNEGYTKGDLLDYYEAISPYLLPFLKNRPITLKRYPDGIEGNSFFQKNLIDYVPNWIKTIAIEHSSKIVNYLLIDDLKSLLYAVNLGAIEIHPFLSKYPEIDFPDLLVLDLDPVEISFDAVIEVAKTAHAFFTELKMTHFFKTSGKRGLHIMIPLNTKYDQDQVKNFAELLANLIYERIPLITSLIREPKKRKNRVYIDYLQNGRTKTVVAPYVVRAVEGAPVSTPINASELKKGLDPKSFTIKTMPKRVQQHGDIFDNMFKKKNDISTCLKKIGKAIEK